MAEKDNFKKIIGLAGSGTQYPVMDLIKNDPGLAATLSKLITPREPAIYNNSGNRDIHQPNTFGFKNVSEHLSQNIADAKTVLQTLPDMELTAQILVSSILSPKDMVTIELNYHVDDDFLAPDVSAALLAICKKHFEHDYKIKPLLSKILRDCLFETGSYALAVIPENSVDEVINGSGKVSMESFSNTFNSDGSMKPLGILGPVNNKKPTIERKVPGLSMESFSLSSPDITADEQMISLEGILNSNVKYDTYTFVTDNYNLLKVPTINNKLKEQKINNLVGGLAYESFKGNLTDRKISSILYKDKGFTYKPITSLKTQEQLTRRTIGSPLVIHLPSEAIIPVYIPGSPENHIGYFILIDADGNPVHRANDVDHYQQLTARMNSNGSFPSAMLARVKSQMSGFDINNRDSLNYSARVYGEMIEQDLLSRLRNGVYGNGVAIARREEVYRLMLSRALSKQHTQLLFIPIELMTYIAVDYSEDGIGKSLLDNMKILNSLRSMVMLGNVFTSLKNSIGRTEVKIKLDEDDPNPQKTIEIAMHEIVRSRQNQFPLGVNSPNDIVDWLQKASFEFTYEGHPGLPDVNVDFGEKNTNYAKPDTELEELLRKRSIMGAGLSPETVDASYQAEFATSILNNNLLLAKRVIGYQEIFEPQFTDHLRKKTLHDDNLISKLRSTIEEKYTELKEKIFLNSGISEINDTTNKVNLGNLEAANINSEQSSDEIKFLLEKTLYQFITMFNVTLVKPNSVTLENLVMALETYTKALDLCLDAYINDRFFTTDTVGEVANQINTLKEVLRAYYIRRWMANNGMMAELSELCTTTVDNKPTVDIYELQESHIESLTKSLTKYMVGIQKTKEASDVVINSITDSSSESEFETSDSENSNNSDGNDGSSFDLPEMPSMDEPSNSNEEPVENVIDDSSSSNPESSEVNKEDKEKNKDETKETNLNGDTI